MRNDDDTFRGSPGALEEYMLRNSQTVLFDCMSKCSRTYTKVPNLRSISIPTFTMADVWDDDDDGDEAGGGDDNHEDEEGDDENENEDPAEEEPEEDDEDGDGEEEEDILDMEQEVPVQHDALLMRFCPHDSSMLYPQENKREKMLQYACRLCRYTEPAPNAPLVYRNERKKEVVRACVRWRRSTDELGQYSVARLAHAR
jgi:RNA polymerases M/15 Kd subunit